MNNKKLIELAKKYCEHFHDGQFRKGSNLPYHTHPIEVASILEKFGYADTITQCIALLHDVVEDTNIITGEIKERFGYEIANGVFVLSKNTISNETIEWLDRSLSLNISNLSEAQQYKLRLSFSRRKIRRVKIADMIHNTQDLVSLSKPGSIEKKISDAEEFYIPMGRKIAPIMIKELEKNITDYNKQILN
ncbi:MAG: HD domain-containing protein [Bacteroidota bacterium]